jgi:hypothetical protein
MRMRWWALLVGTSSLMVLPLADVGNVPSAGAAATEMSFSPPVQVSADDTQSAAEPSIRAALDGTIYIVAPTGLGNTARDGAESTGGDVIWRSEDNGKTWTFLGSLDENVGGGDADIAPDAEGTLWGSGLTLANTTASISTDKGDNFTVNPVGTLSTVVDRQWIETYKAEPFAFMTTGEIGTGTVLLSRLERLPGDIPAVSNTVRIEHEQGYQWPGEIAVDEKNDYVYVAYNTPGGDSDNADDIMVARTDLNLGGLTQFKVTTTVGDSFDSFVAVDVDRAGNIYVVWSERRKTNDGGKKKGTTNSYLGISEDGGETWGQPIKLNTRPRSTAFPWVAAGDEGRVAVAYYGTRRAGPSPEDVIVEGRRVPKWRVFVSYSLNATKGASFTEMPAMSLGDHLHKGNVCTSGTGCAAGTRDLLDFFQLDLTPCGKIAITYTDNSRDVVDASGQRTSNLPEWIYYVGQKGGPSFPDAC